MLDIKRGILVGIDFLFLPIGLALLGSGLWMYKPWVSLTVIGAIITILAVAIELRSK